MLAFWMANVNTDDISHHGGSLAYHHGDLQTALLSAARARIATDGADALSLRALARGLNVDPSAAYRHFRDKQALLVAVAGAGFVELADAMEAALNPGADADGDLVAVGMAYIAYGKANPRLFDLMFGLAGALQRGAIAADGHKGRDAYVIFEQALRAARPALDEGRRARCAAQMWATVHGLADLMGKGLLFTGPQDSPERILRDIVAGIGQ